MPVDAGDTALQYGTMGSQVTAVVAGTLAAGFTIIGYSPVIIGGAAESSALLGAEAEIAAAYQQIQTANAIIVEVETAIAEGAVATAEIPVMQAVVGALRDSIAANYRYIDFWLSLIPH